MKQRLLEYLKNDRHIWWSVTVIPGVYCILYLYTNNFTLVNSWYQLMWCVLVFIALPVAEILVLDFIFKKWLPRWRPHLYWCYLLINFALILSFIVFGYWRYKGLALVIIASIISSFFIAKHYKKLVLLFALMCVVAAYQFVHFYVERVVYREDWVDTTVFENIKFKKHPNIYLIQPDGFVNKQAAQSSFYDLDLSAFYSRMEALGFEFNHEYRSNYPSTLTSNSALFTGQQHLFENGNMESELYGARDLIVGNNPVISTLKRNGYRTNLILQHSYLMLNFPEVAYDYVNVSESDLSVPLPDYWLDADYMQDFKNRMNAVDDRPQFFFLEILEPGHIPNNGIAADSEIYTADYKSQLLGVTEKLINLVNFIEEKDPNGIIIIAADHGGYVGFENSLEPYHTVVEDPDLKRSIYGSLFAIKAKNDFHRYGPHIRTSVTVFPVLFQYLAQQPPTDPELDNSSFMFIKNGSERGVYQYFDPNGLPITERLDP
ncbi:sulfatase-like hydrolase/transferase [Nonlabens agnitus]|uniref:Sulfatase N-terminal domain-containing protein n=1 Tax=Nonlabens agnitus TaxID=870484 RepID=A0A2S9WXI5_9FLAO|nr:sulfatase-like hydrolase/transferase [Nonlabens agnitus]PRP68192.1 hypothetical protein BST86_14405 [Nonlabens agnitus]